jgi:hypothetical protein
VTYLYAIMLLGSDFDKIEWSVGRFTFLEPNVFLTDIIMSLFCFYFGWRLYHKTNRLEKTKWWIAFFWLFALSSFAGGLGHFMFAHWGVNGKFASWITSFPSIYFIERAMISAEPNENNQRFYVRLANAKMLLMILVFASVCVIADLNLKPEKGFLPIAANTIIGVSATTGFLGWLYAKKLHHAFNDFLIGMLIILPSAFVFLLKINISPWFDKNDLSHVFITLGLYFFYRGAMKVEKHVESDELQFRSC